MNRLHLWKRVYVITLFCAAMTIVSPAQSLTTLVQFTGADGRDPGSLVQGLDGNFYGTTFEGGRSGNLGTVFKVTPAGVLTTLHRFGGTGNPANPLAGLVLGADGNFYGTFVDTVNPESPACPLDGGAGGVFKMTPGGLLSTLHNFVCGAGPECPVSRLIQSSDGSFWGTTQNGGNSVACPGGCGTVFRITRDGTLTTMYNFGSADGANPYSALVQGANGNVYGTTHNGGLSTACPGGCGTIFKITVDGELTTMHHFGLTDGASPSALLQARDGSFYGTTMSGGANGYGTIFKITPAGALTTLHSFQLFDGAYPTGLIQATDGNFYGQTQSGGTNCYGTIFEMSPAGVLTTLHTFSFYDGSNPAGGSELVQGTDGNLYGTTTAGGSHSAGTIFSLSVGLGPFVKTLPASGRVGAVIRILGTNLTGATSVTFNGSAASFTVVAASEILATIPAGATTGEVQVTAPGGTLPGDQVFRVR